LVAIAYFLTLFLLAVVAVTLVQLLHLTLAVVALAVAAAALHMEITEESELLLKVAMVEVDLLMLQEPVAVVLAVVLEQEV
jgi:hypothetical protein